MNAIQLFNQAKNVLKKLRDSKESPSDEIQHRVGQLLSDSMDIAWRKKDYETLALAANYLIKLFHDGHYEFTVNYQKLQNILDKFYLTAKYFYKLPAILAGLDSITSPSSNNQRSDYSTELLIQSLEAIRVIVDSSLNYGNQSTNINLISRLRQMGFKGVIEFIYSDYEIEKLATLLDIAPYLLKEHGIYYEQKLKIRFITFSHFFAQRNLNQIASLQLAITAAINILNAVDLYRLLGKYKPEERGLLKQVYQNNFANFFNVNVYVQLPYALESVDAEIHQRDNPNVIKLDGSRHKFIITPIANFAQTEDYLNSHSRGLELIKNIPALSVLVTAIKVQSINFLPAYSRAFKESSYKLQHLCKIILGAQHAQSNGPTALHKPLVIALFLDMPEDDLKQLSAVFSTNVALRNTTTVLHLSNLLASTQIKQLRNDHILVLIMDRLPKNVFDGLFTHNADNIWPPIREGVSSGTSLALRGKAHGFCRYETPWEILKLAEPKLRSSIERLSACSIDDFKDFGEAVIEAQTPNSNIAKFFKVLKNYFSNPEQDLIRIALNTAGPLVNLTVEETKNHLTPFLHFGIFDSARVVSAVPQSFAANKYAVCRVEQMPAIAPHRTDKVLLEVIEENDTEEKRQEPPRAEKESVYQTSGASRTISPSPVSYVTSAISYPFNAARSLLLPSNANAESASARDHEAATPQPPASTSTQPLSFNEHLIVLQYALGWLQKNTMWGYVKSWANTLCGYLPWNQMRIINEKEQKTLIECQQKASVLIQQIERHGNTPVAKTSLYKEKLLPFKQKLQKLSDAISLLLKNKQATSSQSSDIANQVNEIQTTIKKLDLKQLNKVLRQAEIVQTRLNRRANDSGHHASQIVVERREQIWVTRRLTGKDRLEVFLVGGSSGWRSNPSCFWMPTAHGEKPSPVVNRAPALQLVCK